jgi:hypothetical protein
MTRRARGDPHKARTRRRQKQRHLKRLRQVGGQTGGQTGGYIPADQVASTIKERIDGAPPNGRPIALDGTDPYFNPPIEFDPTESFILQGLKERFYDINVALRTLLHIFDPADPARVKDSAAFAAMISAKQNPADTSIQDSMQYLLDLEGALRTAAGAEPITDKNLANQNHYPLYLWFLAAPTLEAPADGRRPLPLTQEEINELVSKAI